METLNPNPNLNPMRRPAPGSARALAEKFPSLEGSGVSSVPLPGGGRGGFSFPSLEGLGVGSRSPPWRGKGWVLPAFMTASRASCPPRRVPRDTWGATSPNFGMRFVFGFFRFIELFSADGQLDRILAWQHFRFLPSRNPIAFG